MPKSFYDAVGGAKTFDAIVSRFYAQVAEDEVLRRVYPEDDLAGAEERLRMFLEQYWGGPRTYSEQRGHPDCGCGMPRFGSRSSNATPGCGACIRLWPPSTQKRSMTSTVESCWIIWRWPLTRWSTPRFDGPTPATGSMGPGSPRASARRPEPDPMGEPWWSRAVFYQVYPRSFADSNGDGVGDLDGLASRLDHLQQLGVDAIWINPVTVSPMADHGYDVADPRDIDPLFGGMPAFERLVAAAHRQGIKVTMDVVPNHTTSAHPWFQAALADLPGSPARDRYFFRDGRGPDGSLPPNNWESVFGGPAWTRVREPDGNPGQWYLHLFDTEQPDLNWDNPEILDDFEKTLRFWLDRGVDGFRIDVAHGMAKPRACRTHRTWASRCCTTAMTTRASTTRMCTRFTATSAR